MRACWAVHSTAAALIRHNHRDWRCGAAPDTFPQLKSKVLEVQADWDGFSMEPLETLLSFAAAEDLHDVT
jgi:hypothetical protein